MLLNVLLLAVLVRALRAGEVPRELPDPDGKPADHSKPMPMRKGQPRPMAGMSCRFGVFCARIHGSMRF